MQEKNKQTYRRRGIGRRPNKNVQEQRQPKDKLNIIQNQTISIVIPMFNEEESLDELSYSLYKVLNEMKSNYEVLFIDDGSTDNSYQKTKEINTKNSRFHCIKLRKNYGKSSALSVGFKNAKGDIIITMDADLQDDPEEIPELVSKINSGFDLVSGWKKVRYDPFIKKHTSKFFNFFASIISGIKLHDFNCGLKAYKKDVIKSIKVYGELHRYIPALAHLSGYKVTEKVVKHKPRKYGVTKFGASRFFKGFFDLLTVLFTTRFIKRPLHLFGTLGLISFFIGTGITVYLSIMKIFYNEYLTNRPLFLVGVMFIILGVQSFSLGLIGEMITRSYYTEEDILIEEIL